MKLELPDVTLVLIDTTPKQLPVVRALRACRDAATFGGEFIKTVPIGTISSLDDYSEFCIRELYKHIKTSHCLVVQADGYILNPSAWNPEFLKYDYIGAPWLPSGTVGNGGFSLRSGKLLWCCSTINDNPHPEDNFICVRHRKTLEQMGCRFAPPEVASSFAFEGRSWNNGVEWQGVPKSWDGQFGFHSWLTPLPPEIQRPKIFHHTGDLGDVIYSVPTIRALGGGVLFLSDDNKYPFPRKSRERVTAEWVNNIKPLLEAQDCIERVSFTHGLPFSTNHDLNRFRRVWGQPHHDLSSIFQMHLDEFGVKWPEQKPWLTIDRQEKTAPIVVNATERYRNWHFPWTNLIKKYHQDMTFVGTKREYGRFSELAYGVGKVIHWTPTDNLLELARVISGSKVFIGNQSCPMAIALGLGVNVIQEVWQGNPNCLFQRPNAIFWGVQTIDPDFNIPESWLK